MSTPPLTTTSYAVLGLLAVQPWSTYELTRQMDRSLGRFWPRAASKLYEEPKKLVAHGLADASSESVGRRPRTIYSITRRGRRALAMWLREPGAAPELEFEQLLKVFYSDNGRKRDLLASLDAARSWARDRSAESHAVGEQYLAGTGPFPQRAAQHALTVRFLTDFYSLIRDWADWATETVQDWPDDPGKATVDRSVMVESVGRAARAAGLSGPSAGRGRAGRAR